MKVFAWAACGLLSGAALFSSACFCSQPAAPDGAFVVASWDKETQELDLSVDVDVPRVRETFTRNGRKYEIEYRAVAETEYGISGTTPRSTKTFDAR